MPHNSTHTLFLSVGIRPGRLMEMAAEAFLDGDAFRYVSRLFDDAIFLELSMTPDTAAAI
jgi:hypothetical protein